MLHRDGVSMNGAARKSFLSYLSAELKEAVDYFAKQIDVNSNTSASAVTVQPSQPAAGPAASTPIQGTSGFGNDSSLGWAEAFRTPPQPPQPPKSGVTLVLSWNVTESCIEYICFSAMLPSSGRACQVVK